MNKKGDFLKIIALISMLIDHVGYLLYPDITVLRIIGRLSFPIFCLLLARGFRRTSNRTKYALRMFILAIISQIPYNIFSPTHLNIFFTLFLGILIMWIFESSSPITACLLPLLTFFIPLQYGIYGLYMILIFYIFNEKKIIYIPSFLILNIIYFTFTINWIQLGSIIAIIPLLLEKDIKFRVPKWFGYMFYPIHIIILLAINNQLSISAISHSIKNLIPL